MSENKQEQDKAIIHHPQVNTFLTYFNEIIVSALNYYIVQINKIFAECDFVYISEIHNTALKRCCGKTQYK